MSQNESSLAPNPARLYLPKLSAPPSTILEYLLQRFPQIGQDVWLERIKAGRVSEDNSTLITTTTPYCFGKTIHYYREVESELKIPFQEKILFQNEHLLVVDKPHFLPVTPSGQSVNECLLSRLQRQTGIKELSPVHRLDRDTAGLVLFSTVKKTRHLYHKLFADRKVIKKYFAISTIPDGVSVNAGQEWQIENRIGQGEPWLRMQIVPGAVNAITRIILTETRGDLGLFELFPVTGKKHQLRIHLMSLGFPIVNDCFYPDLNQAALSDYSCPLQLLAHQIRLSDPLSGKDIKFESQQRLIW